MQRAGAVIIVSIAIAAVVAASAEARYRTFVSPSRAVICRIVVPPASEKEKPYVRCDIYGATNSPPPKPASCKFDFGFSFGMSARGKAGRNCVSDAIADPSKAKVLAYGSKARLGGIVCKSRRSGMTCTNRSSHGFTLARERQKLF